MFSIIFRFSDMTKDDSFKRYFYIQKFDLNNMKELLDTIPGPVQQN